MASICKITSIIYPTAKRINVHSLIPKKRSLHTSCAKRNVDESAPVKYSTSGASAKMSVVLSPSYKMPWYQPYVVVISTGAFLLYFCVLREESDIDLELTKSMHERLPDFEEEPLRNVKKLYKMQGIDPTPVINRIKEFEDKKKVQE